MSGLENPSDAQTKYLGPKPLLRHTKRKLAIGSLSLMMASRDECRWVEASISTGPEHRRRVMMSEQN